MQNFELLNLLNGLLKPENFKDYCPNGLQIEGKAKINKVVCGVSLNLALIEAAINKQADAIITHHGVLWEKEGLNITGVKYQRIKEIIKNELNLFSYHLPLDNHPELGNNVQLAKLLDIKIISQSGEQNLLWAGKLNQDSTLKQFANCYLGLTGHKPIVFGDLNRKLRTIAWCSGGADSFYPLAIEQGVDVFLTGEINETVVRLSQECKTAFIAGGHYVTERYGIKALSQYLGQQCLESEFVELYTPI